MLRVCVIFGTKMTHLSRTNFFWYKPLLLLSSAYWPFSLCKIYKKFLQRIQSYEDASFLGPKWFICPKQIFLLKKIINTILIYLLAPFIMQNFKKNLRANPELWGCAIFWPNLSWAKLFGTNHYYYFHLPIGPFHCAKLKKILQADPELWGCAIFGPKMVHLPQIFFWKIINIILIYLLAPFIVQNF